MTPICTIILMSFVFVALIAMVAMNIDNAARCQRVPGPDVHRASARWRC